MRDTNPRLTRMFHEWEQAEKRKEMAKQTLEGATAEALVREAKFKGAVDFIGGPGATWEFDQEHGFVVVTNGPPEAAPKNGHKSGREIVLDGKMSGKQMKAVMGAQAHRTRKR